MTRRRRSAAGIGGEGIDAKDGCSTGVISGDHAHDISGLVIYVDAWDEDTSGIDVSAYVVHDCDANGMAIAAEAGGLLENVRVVSKVFSHFENVGITPGPGTRPGRQPRPSCPAYDMGAYELTVPSLGQHRVHGHDTCGL